MSEIDNPHGNDEADGSKDSDARKLGNRVEPRLFERVVRNRVAQGEGRHVECNSNRIDREELPEGYVLAVGHAQITNGEHAQRRHKVAETKHLLCLNPSVGSDTDDSRHKN